MSTVKMIQPLKGIKYVNGIAYMFTNVAMATAANAFPSKGGLVFAGDSERPRLVVPFLANKANLSVSSGSFLKNERCKAVQRSWTQPEHSRARRAAARRLELHAFRFMSMTNSRIGIQKHSHCRSVCVHQSGGPATGSALQLYEQALWELHKSGVPNRSDAQLHPSTSHSNGMHASATSVEHRQPATP